VPGRFAARELTRAKANLVVFTPDGPLLKQERYTVTDSSGLEAGFFTITETIDRPPLDTIQAVLDERVAQAGDAYRCESQASLCGGPLMSAEIEWSPRSVRVPTLTVFAGTLEGWLFTVYATTPSASEGPWFYHWTQLIQDLKEGGESCVTVEAVHVTTEQQETRTLCRTGPVYSDATREAPPPTLKACMGLPWRADTKQPATELLPQWCRERSAYCETLGLDAIPSNCPLRDSRCAAATADAGSSMSEESVTDAASTASQDPDRGSSRANQERASEGLDDDAGGCSLGSRTHRPHTATLLWALLSLFAVRRRFRGRDSLAEGREPQCLAQRGARSATRE
jgi:hypothetical protein